MAIFFLIFFTVYTSLNYYVFIRGWQVLSSYPHLRIYYLILFVLIAYSYIIAKVFYNYLHPVIHDALIWLGSFWVAFLVYFILSLIVVDVVRFIGFKFSLFPTVISANYQFVKQLMALAVIIVVTFIVIAGYSNTRNVDIKKLEINIPKGSSELTELNIVMAGDIHLSPINAEKFLLNIVEKINSLNADIVLFPGDIIDDRAEVLKRLNIGEAFKNIKSKYGVYASNGNHEFINGVETADLYMKECRINVLRDSVIKIDNTFYVAAREDRSKSSFTGKKRKSLEEIIKDIDRSYPVILLDHTPMQLEEAERNNIDLQLSGHTHHGQFFPGNLITKMVYELSWGYLKKNNTNYYVTSGAGTWGPPVRNVSKSEIVNIKVKFFQ
jgi:uncharacterized protein